MSKRFGGRAAVDRIDLSVPRGSVFGFLGPNGSGKTTTIRMLLGLIEASDGEIDVLGHEVPRGLHRVLPRVGALVEGPAFYPFLSGTANLRRLDSADSFAVRSTRNARIGAAIDRVGLSHAASKKVHAYSLGMKQRLGIAHALGDAHNLLVLDEPTNGLDPQGTREVRSLIRSLAGEGTTVFVSSHLLAEIEQMCTHAAIMSSGRLVAQGTLDELRQAGTARIRLETPDDAPARRVLASLGLEVAPSGASGGPGDFADFGGSVTAAVSADVAPETIVASLVEAGVRVRGFEVRSESLEDRFVELTGEGFNVAG
nr:ABC transporter ATP-binding protein [Spelaeicoccus albus]